MGLYPQGVTAIEDETLDVRRYISVFLSRWWLMVLVPLVMGLAAFAYSRHQEPVYEAKATLLVQQRRGGLTPGASDFALSEQLASTYSRLVRTSPFLTRVLEKNDLPQDVASLKKMIAATPDSNPPVVEIAVRHTNPVMAATIADVVAHEFIDYVIEQRLAEIARLQSAATAQGIINVQELVAAQLSAVDGLYLLEPVVIPAVPVLPRSSQNIILGVLVGILLATGGALFLESLGDTVRSPEEIGRKFGVTTLGTIFRWSAQDADDRGLVLWKAPSSSYAEAFRQVRANIQFATANKPGNVFLVCSPGPGEGKSTVTCNLAIALAQSGKRVVVVDGDLRRASVHRKLLGTRREPGLSNFLADPSTQASNIASATAIQGVSVIPSGPTPPNPAELLGSQRMAALLAQLKQEFDIVLVDSPPVLLVADGALLASQVDGAIIVVDGTRTRTSSLKAALDTLRNTKVHILGVIINKLKRSRFGYGYGYGYSYLYYYSYYGTSDKQPSANGHQPLYKRPVHWVKSRVSRSHGA